MDEQNVQIEAYKLTENRVTKKLKHAIDQKQINLSYFDSLPEIVYPKPQLARLSKTDDKDIFIASAQHVTSTYILFVDNTAKIYAFFTNIQPLQQNCLYALTNFQIFTAKSECYCIVLYNDNQIINLQTEAKLCGFKNCNYPIFGDFMLCNKHYNKQFQQFNQKLEFKQSFQTNFFKFKDMSKELGREYQDYIHQQNLIRESEIMRKERKFKLPVAIKFTEQKYENQIIDCFHCKDCNKVYLEVWKRCLLKKHNIIQKQIWKFESYCETCDKTIITFRNDETCVVCGQKMKNLIDMKEVQL